MEQEQRLAFLIQALLKEEPAWREVGIPGAQEEQKRLLRALLNTRPPRPASVELLRVQDEYLQEELRLRGVTDAETIPPMREGLCLWRGDITTLKADAVVNAANSRLLGCFIPCHRCIDNAIHTFAGIQLRLACHELMERRGSEEPTGRARITPAFNLPSRYVLHTVGPVVCGPLTGDDRARLASCYRSCLELAEENGVRSLAFCCISTGEFHFPNDAAAEIAVQTVRDTLRRIPSKMKVIFNVFTDADEAAYRRLLTADGKPASRT